MKRKRIFMVLLCIFMLGGTITAYAGEKLETPDSGWWEGYNAGWDEVENAYRYEVRLYRNSTEVTMVKTTRTSVDFTSKYTKEGNYRFKVRAMGKGDFENSNWSAYSEENSVDEEHIKQLLANTSAEKKTTEGGSSGVNGPGTGTPQTGAWIQDAVGWWYRYSDGHYSKNVWDQISGKWYFFDETGYMKTGWISHEGHQYYCDATGAMLTGSHQIDGKEYSFNSDGSLAQ